MRTPKGKIPTLKLEYRIKELPKSQKEELIKNKCLEKYFSEKIETEKYKVWSGKIGKQNTKSKKSNREKQ